jgi:hypothetical protein
MVVPAYAKAMAGKLRGESFDELRIKYGIAPSSPKGLPTSPMATPDRTPRQPGL